MSPSIPKADPKAATTATGGEEEAPGCGRWTDYLSPAVGEAVFDAFRGHALQRLLGDQVEPGVGVAGRLCAAVRELHDCCYTQRRHPQRVLLRRGVDDSSTDVAHAGATAVNGDDGHSARLLAGVLQSGPGACGARLVDRVDDVDVRVRLLAAAVRHTGDLLVVVLDPEPLEEPVVTQRAYRRSRVLVEHRDRHLAALRRRACV